MIRWLTQAVRNYFGFSRRETRGVFVLMIIISLALFTTIYIEKNAYQHYQTKAEDQYILDSLITVLNDAIVESPIVVASKKENKELFRFDPNTAPYEAFLKLGVSEKLSKRIVNYRNKGGKFYEKGDLLKIYGFPENLYAQLRPYIYISQKAQPKHSKKTFSEPKAVQKVTVGSKTSSAKYKPQLLDINLADSSELKTLRGIGDKLSARIIKYRNKLGGFHSKAQLKEIFHISDMALESLNNYTFIQQNFSPQKIKINEAEFKTLLSHPYIDYELAKSIMNHRRIYGNFSSTEQLKEVYYMKEELLVKLLPYVVI